MTMEEKIWIYPELSASERTEIDGYVASRPDLAETLRRSKAFWAMIDEAGALRRDPPSDEAIAFFAVMGEIDRRRMPEELRKAMVSLQSRIDEDPALRARAEAMLRRRSELEKASDAGVQLQRLTGRDPTESILGAGADAVPASGLAGRRRRRSLLGAGGAVLAGVAVLYMALFAIGRLTRPAEHRLASFDRSELVVEGYSNVRGEGQTGAASDPVEQYLEALEELRRAETSILGLFPRFDEIRLERAADRLRAVLETEPEESFLADEARYLLAKAELALGRPDNARELLEETASAGGLRSEDASRILEALGR